MSPTLSGAKNVAIRETTASGKPAEVGQRESSTEEVSHMYVNSIEARFGKCPGHFDVAINTLLSENSNFGTVRRIADRGWAVSEGEVVIYAFIVWVANEVEFLFRCDRAIAKTLHPK